MLTSRMLRSSRNLRSLSVRTAAKTPTVTATARFFSAERKTDDHDEEEASPASTAAATTTTSRTSTSTSSSKPQLPIDFTDISRADIAIRGGVKRTTCEKSPFISELIGANVYFKNEFRQFTGSFKERGARNAILQLMREKKSSLRGVIAASAGNHALALAYHGQQLGIPVTVVMPTVAPLAKVDKCRVSI